MSMVTRSWLLSVVLIGLCTQAALGQEEEERRIRRDRNRITAEEIAHDNLEHLNGYQVVERLRRRWLTPAPATPGELRSGQVGGSTPAVFVDGMRRGGVEVLGTLQASDIQELRYLNARDANLRYGTGFPAGIILVVTQAGGSPRMR